MKRRTFLGSVAALMVGGPLLLKVDSAPVAVESAVTELSSPPADYMVVCTLEYAQPVTEQVDFYLAKEDDDNLLDARYLGSIVPGSSSAQFTFYQSDAKMRLLSDRPAAADTIDDDTIIRFTPIEMEIA